MIPRKTMTQRQGKQRTILSAKAATGFGTPQTVTITIATPGVLTLASHGLKTGDAVFLTTTGALPTGISASTRYWVIKLTDSTFMLATSLANASAGTAIATSGTQSGVHSVLINAYGMDVSQYRFIGVAVIGASSPNLTVKCQGSFLMSYDPNLDFTAAASATNPWDYVAMDDLQDGMTRLTGDTGVVFGGSNDCQIFKVNTDSLRSLNFQVTARAAGNVTIIAFPIQ